MSGLWEDRLILFRNTLGYSLPKIVLKSWIKHVFKETCPNTFFGKKQNKKGVSLFDVSALCFVHYSLPMPNILSDSTVRCGEGKSSRWCVVSVLYASHDSNTKQFLSSSSAVGLERSLFFFELVLIGLFKGVRPTQWNTVCGESQKKNLSANWTVDFNAAIYFL